MSEAERIAAWLKSWVPSGQRRCKGYDAACQCSECQDRDRRLPHDVDADPLPEPTHTATRCHGFANCCNCAKCKARAKIPGRSGSCSCATKYPDANGHCRMCGRAVRGFFEAEAEHAVA